MSDTEDQRLDDALSLMQRGFEVLIGVALSVASLFPLGVCGVLVKATIDGDVDLPVWIAILCFVIAGRVFWWCVETSWRLLTGRERRSGGLLSPTMLGVVGIGCLGGAVAAIKGWGLPAIGSAVLFSVMGLTCFSLARSRLRRARTRTEAATGG